VQQIVIVHLCALEKSWKIPGAPQLGIVWWNRCLPDFRTMTSIRGRYSDSVPRLSSLYQT
jgi:hypothetical protein